MKECSHSIAFNPLFSKTIRISIFNLAQSFDIIRSILLSSEFLDCAALMNVALVSCTSVQNYVGRQHEREKFIARNAISNCCTALKSKGNSKARTRMKYSSTSRYSIR